MIDTNILMLKLSGNASNYAVEEEHLQQVVFKHFGNIKGQEVLMKLNEYLIGSTLPVNGIYPWDMAKAFNLLDIPVIFTDKIGRPLNLNLDSSGVS